MDRLFGEFQFRSCFFIFRYDTSRIIFLPIFRGNLSTESRNLTSCQVTLLIVIGFDPVFFYLGHLLFYMNIHLEQKQFLAFDPLFTYIH